MAESFPENPIGQFSINIRNDKVKVSSTDVTTIVTAVKKTFDGERDDQQLLDIRPGSLHVRCCFTDKRFLEVLADYESGKMKERLEEEFSNAGIKVEGLKVEIENLAEANEPKEAIETRYNRCFIKRLCNVQKGFPLYQIYWNIKTFFFIWN
jgi:hypothetical protein